MLSGPRRQVRAVLFVASIENDDARCIWLRFYRAECIADFVARMLAATAPKPLAHPAARFRSSHGQI